MNMKLKYWIIISIFVGVALFFAGFFTQKYIYEPTTYVEPYQQTNTDSLWLYQIEKLDSLIQLNIDLTKTIQKQQNGFKKKYNSIDNIHIIDDDDSLLQSVLNITN